METVKTVDSLNERVPLNEKDKKPYDSPPKEKNGDVTFRYEGKAKNAISDRN